MTACTSHPIWLLGRTDADLTTLFHSFILIDIDKNQEVNVLLKIPEQRAGLEDVISGLQFFMKDLYDRKSLTAKFGSFVITTSIGSRFHLSWASSSNRYFISVSQLQLCTFSKSLFNILNFEELSKIPSILRSLCESPILPVCGIRYKFGLSAGPVYLEFTKAGQIADSEVSVVSLTQLTANMMVAAWEAIILERKVLVTSSSPALIPCCCEFLRHLVLPLPLVNTFVPLLPESLISTIEAPFPYLVGADAEYLKRNQVDVSDTVVVDLDASTVNEPKSISYQNNAPNFLKAQLISEIKSILRSSMVDWVSNISSFPNTSSSSSSIDDYPTSLAAMTKKATDIQSCFSRTNLELMTARACNTRALFRHPKGADFIHSKYRSTQANAGMMTQLSKKDGVFFGCIQLLKGKDSKAKFVPCWLEMDGVVFAVYEYADEFPLVYTSFKDIEMVSPSPAEPEGHVFEVEIRPQITYSFAATDPESRWSWIQTIEEITKFSSRPREGTTGSHWELECRRHSSSTAVNGEDTQLKTLQDYALSDFRYQVMKTQMTAVLRSKLEFDDYEPIFSQLGRNILQFSEPISPVTVTGTSTTGGGVTSSESQSVSEPLPLEGGLGLPVKSSSDSELPLPKRSLSEEGRSGESNATGSHSHRKQQRGASMSGELMALCTDISMTWAEEVSSEMLQRRTSVPGSGSVPGEEKESGTTRQYTSSSTTSADRDGEKKLGGGSSSSSSASSSSGLLEKGKGVLGGIFKRSTAYLTHKDVPMMTTGSSTTDDLLSGNGSHPAAALTSSTEKREDMSSMRQKLAQIAATHRRCEGNIQRRLIEDRMTVMLALHSINDAIHKTPTAITEHSVETNIYNIEDMTVTLPVYDATGAETAAANGCKGDWISNYDSTAGTEGGQILDEHYLRLVRKQILENLQTQILQSRSNRTRDHLLPILYAMVGYLIENYFHDSIDSDMEEKCLEECCLMDSRQIMLTIAQKFSTWTTSSSSIPNECTDHPDHDPSSRLTGGGGRSASDISSFLSWASDISPLIGLQALRLVTEVIHRSLTLKAGRTLMSAMNLPAGSPANASLSPDNGGFDDVGISDAGSLPQPKLQAGNSSLHSDEDGGGLSTFRRDMALGVLSRKRGATSVERPNFSWVTSDSSRGGSGQRSDILNEAVQCTMATSAAVELSVQLLTRIREILKAAYDATMNSPDNLAGGRPSTAHSKVRLYGSTFSQVQYSSAFRAFEVQSCQLQRVSVAPLSCDQKTLFFCNIYNTIAVHALVVRGLPGNGLYDRIAFMRGSKYNIGGLTLSLLQIEHSLLRAQSSTPSFVVPLLSSIALSDRDPRKALALTSPRPLVSFCLFTATESSPALLALRDPATVDADMRKCASSYLQTHMKIDRATRTVTLPEIIRFYWKDFGGTRTKVLKTVSQLLPAPLGADLRVLVEESSSKIRVSFIPYDWTPTLIL